MYFEKLKKNKQGNIPITILVFGVLAICIAAIFSFYFSYTKLRKGFNDIYIVEKVAITKENIDFYMKNFNFREDEIKNIFKIQNETKGFCYYEFINMTKSSISVRDNLKINCRKV